MEVVYLGHMHQRDLLRWAHKLHSSHKELLLLRAMLRDQRIHAVRKQVVVHINNEQNVIFNESEQEKICNVHFDNGQGSGPGVLSELYFDAVFKNGEVASFVPIH